MFTAPPDRRRAHRPEPRETPAPIGRCRRPDLAGPGPRRAETRSARRQSVPRSGIRASAGPGSGPGPGSTGGIAESNGAPSWLGAWSEACSGVLWSRASWISSLPDRTALRAGLPGR